MGTRSAYRDVIVRVLWDYTFVPYAHGQIESQTVFDREGDHHLLMIFGKDGGRGVHGCLLHIDLVDERVVIRRDGNRAPHCPRARARGGSGGGHHPRAS